MKISLNQLRQMIGDQGRKVNDLNYELMDSATKTGHREASLPDGIIEYITDPLDYNETLGRIQKGLELLVLYKNKLTKANANTLLEGENMSIIDAINFNTEHRQFLKTLERSLGQKATKYRRDTQNGSSYYEIVELNFRKEDVEKLREEIKSRINQLEEKIDQANASTFVEMP